MNISDRPVDALIEDRLGRVSFVDAVSRLMLDSPPGAGLKLAVYGEWGSGKTSILRLLQQRVREAGFATVWLLPWTYGSPQACWRALLLFIARALAIDTRKLETASWFENKVDQAREIAKQDWKASAISALVGGPIGKGASKWSDKSWIELSAKIAEKMNSTKLLVVIDDLDRLEPEMVPRTLLTIRELLDLPNIYYAMALSPSIVQRSLALVHPAWGESREFLEKVIELPLSIPQPDDKEWGFFLKDLLGELTPFIPDHAFNTVSALLPRNPRKGKLFVRHLTSLHEVLKRFRADEVDWRLLLLCQMLALEFPEQAQVIAASKSIIQSIQYGKIASYGKRQGKNSSNESQEHPEAEIGPTEESALRRYRQICSAIRDQVDWPRGGYELNDLILLHQRHPILTWKELDQLVDAAKTDMRVFSLWLDTKSPNARGARADSLFSMLLRARNGSLDEASNTTFGQQTEELLGFADHLLSSIEYLSFNDPGFEPGLLGIGEWRGLYGQVCEWRHFTKPGYYSTRREAERNLLHRITERLPPSTAIEALFDLSHYQPHPGGTPTPELDRTITALRAGLGRITAPLIDDLFLTPSRVTALQAAPNERALAFQLFNIDSDTYQSGYLADLLKRMAGAAVTTTIQQNALSFMRQLAQSAAEVGPISTGSATTMLGDREIVEPLWRLATAHPLNPRLTGSLREERERMIRVGVPNDLLPLPTWWRGLEETFFS